MVTGKKTHKIDFRVSENELRDFERSVLKVQTMLYRGLNWPVERCERVNKSEVIRSVMRLLADVDSTELKNHLATHGLDTSEIPEKIACEAWFEILADVSQSN